MPTQTALTVAALDDIELRVGRMSLALARGAKATRTSGKGGFAVEIGSAMPSRLFLFDKITKRRNLEPMTRINIFFQPSCILGMLHEEIDILLQDLHVAFKDGLDDFAL